MCFFQFPLTFCPHEKGAKLLPRDTFPCLKIGKYTGNAFAAGALPRTRWGAYSAPPDPLAGFGGRGGEKRGRKEGEGRRIG